jgi:hypothetical protein
LIVGRDAAHDRPGGRAVGTKRQALRFHHRRHLRHARQGAQFDDHGIAGLRRVEQRPSDIDMPVEAEDAA